MRTTILFFIIYTCTLQCIGQKLNWEVPINSAEIDFITLIDHNQIFIGTISHNLYPNMVMCTPFVDKFGLIDIESGNLLWEANRNVNYRNSPTVLLANEKSIIIYENDYYLPLNKLTALQKESGAVSWVYEERSELFAYNLVDENKLRIVSIGGKDSTYYTMLDLVFGKVLERKVLHFGKKTFDHLILLEACLLLFKQNSIEKVPLDDSEGWELQLNTPWNRQSPNVIETADLLQIRLSDQFFVIDKKQGELIASLSSVSQIKIEEKYSSILGELQDNGLVAYMLQEETSKSLKKIKNKEERKLLLELKNRYLNEYYIQQEINFKNNIILASQSNNKLFLRSYNSRNFNFEKEAIFEIADALSSQFTVIKNSCFVTTKKDLIVFDLTDLKLIQKRELPEQI